MGKQESTPPTAAMIWRATLSAARAGAASVLGHDDMDADDVAAAAAVALLGARGDAGETATSITRRAFVAGRNRAIDLLRRRHGRAGEKGRPRRVDPLLRALPLGDVGDLPAPELERPASHEPRAILLRWIAREVAGLPPAQRRAVGRLLAGGPPLLPAERQARRAALAALRRRAAARPGTAGIVIP